MSAVKNRPTAEYLRKKVEGMGRKKIIDLSGIVIGTYEPDRWLNITELSQGARAHNAPLDDRVAWNMAWQCIKRSNPAQAERIASPEIDKILKRFKGSSLLIDCNELHKGKGAV